MNRVGKTGQPYAKEWNWTLILISYTKVNSEWIKNLNTRPKTMKLLEENIEVKICGIGFGSGFLSLTLRTKATKAKNK